MEERCKKRTIAFYARVSTEHEAQVNAFENQLDWGKELLKQHPEWTEYHTYYDKGITGTSTQKRPGFMKMLSDAKNHKFDLIVTREVSRFARNTVDTLTITRELKRAGIEVYFVNDNIWSFDSDSELRLTIMASIAQEESRKISKRVAAGQAISRKNGVYYGNGNILGYKRIETKEADKPKEVNYVVDAEQARTVKKIFELYLNGNGLRAIQYELERLGYKTATGKTAWHLANIERVLQNPFYCGVIVYRRQWTPDFLEQKKINNIGDMPFEYAAGTHKPLVSKEDFEKVQNMIMSKRYDNENCPRDEYGKIIPEEGKKRQRYLGKKDAVDVWGELLVCECGRHFNRKVWHRDDNGGVQYGYQCYSQKATGTVKSRENHGLSTEGICNSPMIPHWKLRLMADSIFHNFIRDRKKLVGMIERLAKEMEEQKNKAKNINDSKMDEIKQIDAQISKLKTRVSNFQVMRADGEISKSDFEVQKRKTDTEIENLLKERAELIPAISPEDDDAEERAKRFTEYILQLDYEKDENGHTVLSEEVVRQFVSKIVVHKDYFEWFLRYNPNPDEPVVCTIGGGKRRGDEKPYFKDFSSSDYDFSDLYFLIPNFDYISTGCHQGWQELSCSFLQFAEFTLTIDDAKEYVYSLSTKRRVYNWHDIRVRLYI